MPIPPSPIFPGPIFPGPWPGPPSSTDAGISTALLAFTPVLNSQILAGRARGGNVIDPPLANYHLIQFHATPELLEGLNHSLKITDGVVRYRVIKLKHGTPPPPEQRPAFAATGEPED